MSKNINSEPNFLLSKINDFYTKWYIYIYIYYYYYFCLSQKYSNVNIYRKNVEKYQQLIDFLKLNDIYVYVRVCVYIYIFIFIFESKYSNINISRRKI